MYHFRDARPGLFYRHERYDHIPAYPDETPPFLRFAATRGVALRLWDGEGATADELLPAAGLAWSVRCREVIVPVGPGMSVERQASHYRALVRPDNEQIMSVVTSHYSVAENDWVATAAESLARRANGMPSLISAVGFGREGERTMFAARIAGGSEQATCLLAFNTHGGEGSVRFQIVEADRRTGTTYVLDDPNATASFPHVGDVRDRLRHAPRLRHLGTFVERYLSETPPVWNQLADRLWTSRHTSALIRELWGEATNPTIQKPNGVEAYDAVAARHPGHHLPAHLDGISDAANAYRALCNWIDHHSEACERGDYTKDRTERLALGAGNRYKRNAWRWITANV